MPAGLLLAHDQRQTIFLDCNHNDLGIRALARVPWLQCLSIAAVVADALGYDLLKIVNAWASIRLRIAFAFFLHRKFIASDSCSLAA